MTIKFRKLDPRAILPSRATPGSAGLDLTAIEPVTVWPRCRAMVRTGLAVEVPAGHEGQVRSRSGLAIKFGIAVLNAPGTIDADYRGEVGVILLNHSDTQFQVTEGMRVAQLVVTQVAMVEVVEADDLDETERGAGGFGSSGT